MMSGDSQGLSYLSWDEVDEDVAEGKRFKSYLGEYTSKVMTNGDFIS